ncbi:hypothetical protein [Microbacterium neungamense]|uniref:hypothetical protein n=1 Tax=Microbacterium neungamense TaxID=2810535 RepID=UPI00217D14A2|nr:hypothetical protein [Microbacterium neungamense]UWF78504.1 hypothetical protein JSY13_05800 [Microbacterium neungamense]
MPSRSDDPVAAAIAAGVARLREAVREVAASNPVVLIDGRSGACKTTIARVLVREWPLQTAPQLVALDSIYPGWDGLAEGVETARERILRPHARGLLGTWQRFDWEAGEYAESHAVNPALGLIVEGCGALTTATARLADVRVWVDSPEPSRRHRALGRDGDAFRPHWDRWAAQERAHIARHDPVALADVVIPIP